MVRVGLSLYGYSGSQEYSEVHLQPVLSLCSKIVQLRYIEPGATVGYNRRHRVTALSKIAVVPIGYGDGYLRIYQKFGKVIIGGKHFPIVGDICMDMMMVDVTGAELPVSVGDRVTLIGSDGKQTITAYDIAQSSGFIPYEILTILPQTISRILV
jgi:alanine racemase